MPMPVKLSDELIELARMNGKVNHRSTPKQIEYWSMIGRIAEENPDLPYAFIKGVLLGLKEKEAGKVTPYEFGSEP